MKIKSASIATAAAIFAGAFAVGPGALAAFAAPHELGSSYKAAKPFVVNLSVTGLPTGLAAGVTFSGPRTVTVTASGTKAVRLPQAGLYRWVASEATKDGVTYRAQPSSGSFRASAGKSRALAIRYVPVTPPANPPSPPTDVTATAGEGTAQVTWAAPATDGGSPITGYTVSSSPSGQSCTATSTTSCAVSGLTNGVAYTFTVVARNAAGASQPSLPSAPVTPSFVFTPLNTPVVAPDGMTVTMNSIERTEDVGSIRLTISYTLANGTTDKELEEKGFKLFFADGTATPQYGFFGSLFPGQSKSRTYTWEFLKTKTPNVVEYGSDFFADIPTPGYPKWRP